MESLKMCPLCKHDGVNGRAAQAIPVLAVRDTDDGPDPNGVLPSRSGGGVVASVGGRGSQVLVGVVLALAVAPSVQEGQLLVAALKFHHPTAQIQAAL